MVVAAGQRRRGVIAGLLRTPAKQAKPPLGSVFKRDFYSTSVSTIMVTTPQEHRRQSP